jgi:hypothetical protein
MLNLEWELNLISQINSPRARPFIFHLTGHLAGIYGGKKKKKIIDQQFGVLNSTAGIKTELL